MLAAGKKPRLPKEYQEVEYLRNNGGACIQLTHIPTPGIMLHVEFQLNATVDNVLNPVFYSIRSVDSTYQFAVLASTIDRLPQPASYYKWFSTGDAYQLPSSLGNRHNMEVMANGDLIDNGNIVVWNVSFGAFTNTPLLLMARPNSSQVFIGDFFGFSCWYADSDSFKCDLVPCYRKSDNKPGMYDLCNSICPLTNSPFYINAGTGEFLVGPDVN